MIFIEGFLYACGAGAVLSAGGAIISAAMSGRTDWEFLQTVKPRLVQPAPQPPVGTPWLDYCRDAEAQEAEMYRLCPSAFWLHPDGPLAPIPDRDAAIDAILAELADKPEIAPPCPNRCNAPVLVMADHGGEASLWSCTLCGTDYTRAGKSRVGGKIARAKQEIDRRRERAAEMKRFEMGLDTPHDAMRRQDEAFQEAWARPPAVYGTATYHPGGIPALVNPKATMRISTNPPHGWRLPCGCSIEAAIWKETRDGHRTSKCSQCKAWWYPASNDHTGRTIGQGERVTFRDGTTGPQYFPPAKPTR